MSTLTVTADALQMAELSITHESPDLTQPATYF